MQFVDEGDDLALGLLDLLEDGLEPFLELTAVLGAGDHAGQVQRDQGLVAQGVRNIAGDDALGQPFDDCRLADPGFSDQDRVVLRAPRQHLHDPADLGVTADDRVDLALSRALRQIDAVLLKCLETGLGVLVGDTTVTGDLPQRVEQFGRFDGQQIGLFLRDPDEQVFGGDVGVAALVGEVLGRLQDRVHASGQRGLAHGRTGGGGQLGQGGAHVGIERRAVDADRVEQADGDPLALGKQCVKQVRRGHFRVAVGCGLPDRSSEGVLRLSGEVHGPIVPEQGLVCQ